MVSSVVLIGEGQSHLQRVKKIFDSVEVTCQTLSSMETAFEKIAADPPSLVVAEKPDDMDDLFRLSAILKAKAPLTPFIVLLPRPDVQDALTAMRKGAFDCVVRPFDRFHLLAVAKRATNRNRRNLFKGKLKEPQRRLYWPVLILISLTLFIGGIVNWRNRPPPRIVSLGSAHLAGIQWQDRTFWVGDWYDGTITEYSSPKGFSKKTRKLKTENIYRMRDSQPILVCNTAETLITVGTDLKLRSHFRSVDLPTLHEMSSPGTNPSGLAWDGKYFWSTDQGTGLLYRHGEDLRILGTEKSILANPVGLSADDKGLWVFGGSPLQAAHFERVGKGYVWRGPYFLKDFLPDDVDPSGVAIGFNQLWAVAGGDPKILTRPLNQIFKSQLVWTIRHQKEG